MILKWEHGQYRGKTGLVCVTEHVQYRRGFTYVKERERSRGRLGLCVHVCVCEMLQCVQYGGVQVQVCVCEVWCNSTHMCLCVLVRERSNGTAPELLES